MRKLKVFSRIEFEVEHPLFLARIQSAPSGNTAKVSLNEFERKTVPTYLVMVRYIPKFERVSLDGGPIVTEDQAYRVLYEISVIVGEAHLEEDLLKLTEQAQRLAEANADPSKWKEVAPT